MQHSKAPSEGLAAAQKPPTSTAQAAAGGTAPQAGGSKQRGGGGLGGGGLGGEKGAFRIQTAAQQAAPNHLTAPHRASETANGRGTQQTGLVLLSPRGQPKEESWKPSHTGQVVGPPSPAPQGRRSPANGFHPPPTPPGFNSPRGPCLPRAGCRPDVPHPLLRSVK